MFLSQINLPTSDGLLETLYAYIPNVIAAVIVLVVGWVAGHVVGEIIGRAMDRIGANAAFRRTSVGRAILRAGFTASEFSKAVTKWIIYIAAVLIALENLQIPLADQAINTFMTYLPAFISALLIFIIGFIISDWVGESIKKSFTIEASQAIYISMIGDAVKVILYFVTITIALSQLGIDVTIIYIVAQAFAWSLAIFVGVAAGIVVGWLLKDRVKEWLQRR